MFLPIAPEIEEPESDTSVAVCAAESVHCRTIDVHLDNATDG